MNTTTKNLHSATVVGLTLVLLPLADTGLQPDPHA
jgi:hypothetical protein